MKKKPFNILMVTPWDPISVMGGVSSIVRILSQELSKNENVQWLVQDWNARQLTTQREHQFPIHSLRMRPLRNPEHPYKGFLGWLKDLYPTLRQLRQLMAAQKIDVVHLHYATSFHFYFRILRIIGGPPYILTIHNGDTKVFSRWHSVDREIVRWVIRGAAEITGVSRAIGHDAARLLKCDREIVCVYNGVSQASIGSWCTKFELADLPIALPGRFVVAVGDVSYRKGHDITIKAWAVLTKTLPDVHLLIIGPPSDYYGVCCETVESLGLSDRVHMTGPLPNSAVLAIMTRAVALVFSSRSESFGVVLLEAGLSRLPVVCSSIPAFREIVENEETALVVPSEDSNALADAICRLMRDDLLRAKLSNALFKKVSEEFGATRMAEQYLDIYCRALQPD